VRALISIAGLYFCACQKSPTTVPAEPLANHVRRALAERDQRLRAFRLVVDTTEGSAKAHHEFAFRTPNKSRGHVTAPEETELAFDGSTLARVVYPGKKVEIIPLDQLAPPEKAYFLASTFMPFAPEGYRAPLLPQAGVEAKKVLNPKAPEAVELTVNPSREVKVQYVLRLPAGDFLEKRTQSEGQTKVLRMVTEHCDVALKLCVPVQLQETVNGELLGTTEVTTVDLNPELPQDYFSVK
jgi:hypothetical protein